MSGRGIGCAVLLLAARVATGAAVAAPVMHIEAPPELAGEAERLRRLPPSALDQVERLVGSPARGEPITVALVPEDAALARQAPAWVAGYAYGALSRIVLFPERVPRYPNSTLEELLLHEVAHVLLDRAAGHHPVPRWFHEGVASVAGGPWDLRDGGRLTVAMLRSRRPTPAEIDRLFADPASVSRAYVVADALVRDLLRRHGESFLPTVLARVRGGERFESAFRRVAGRTPDQAAAAFWSREVFWYRWLPVLTSSATLWIAVTFLALLAIRRRRQRDAEIEARWEAEARAVREHILQPPEGPPS